jgi:hypothetical protein
MNKFVEPRPSADPDVAARKLLEIANAHEPYMDGRILIERLNGPMLFQERATPAQYKAGLDYAIDKGWLVLHEAYLREVHPGGRGPVCLTTAPDLDSGPTCRLKVALQRPGDRL